MRNRMPSHHAVVRVNPDLVLRLERHLDCRKPAHIMARLGISLNTWDKLLEGAPIRASVARRLTERFCKLLEDT